MASIHLIEGPVGAGKSTFAGQLSLTHKAPLINLDEWMVTLFSPDRPHENFMHWYMERKDRCIEQIWRVASELIETGNDVVLELGLVQLVDRVGFYSRVDGAGYELHVYLLDAPIEVRRQRVQERNREQGSTFKMEVSDNIFKLANGAWQPPDELEISHRKVETIYTGQKA